MEALFDNEQIVRAYTKEKIEEGREEGWRDGWNDGRAAGWNDGQKEGERKRAVETAQRMIRKGMSPETVADLADLSLSDVLAVQKQMGC